MSCDCESSCDGGQWWRRLVATDGASRRQNVKFHHHATDAKDLHDTAAKDSPTSARPKLDQYE